MKRHLVLIGLPGAGKSTAGRLAAAALGAPFVDGDSLVEARAGKPVARIFAEEGEPAFRALEQAVITDALSGPPGVIAPGGGWAVQPGTLAGAGHALVVHLEVSVPVAAGRVRGAARPLLAGDPEVALGRLAAERFLLYRSAEATVPTDGQSVRDVADSLVQLARMVGGW